MHRRLLAAARNSARIVGSQARMAFTDGAEVYKFAILQISDLPLASTKPRKHVTLFGQDNLPINKIETLNCAFRSNLANFNQSAT